jgi:hypothetical protein
MTLSSNHKRKGIAVIWMAIMFMVILGFMAVMLDYGRAYLAVHQIQNAADAAALAGARYVPIVHDPNTGVTELNIAKDVAYDYGQMHVAANLNVFLDPDKTTVVTDSENPLDYYSDSLTDDIYIGRYIDESGLFFVDHENPDSMLVIGRRDGTAGTDGSHPLLGLMFGSLFGQDSAKFKRVAIAKVLEPYGAGVLALGDCPNCSGLEFAGGASESESALTILNGGSLHVNSTSDEAVFINNKNDILNIERLITVGGANDKFYDSMESHPDAYADADIQNDMGRDYIEPDPYGWDPPGEQPLPDHDIEAIRAMTDLGTIDGSDPNGYSPGYYSGGINIPSGGTINLMPGDYYLDSPESSSPSDATMYMNGGTLIGEGVTLHIIGDANYGVNVGGSTLIDISAPTDGTYAGVSIYQKRNPNYNCEISCSDYPISILKSAEHPGIDFPIDIGGAIYMPHNKLELGGNGNLRATRTIADRFYTIYGSGQKTIDYKGLREVAPASYLVK